MADIRKLEERDIEEVLVMARAMHAEAPEYRDMDFSDEKVRRMLRTMCGTLLVPSSLCALVAEEGGKLIGMMGGFAVEHFFGHDKTASDYVLYVAPEHRRGTTAVRLIRQFEKWAVAQGVRTIIPGVTTGTNNEVASGLYAKLGYERNGYTLIKRVK
ncbi:MAG: GNAT family N-acetyltransferase [Planctomycetes bacterium]|nr:GNAT family N-acetyltransferase [Planctomycetota bacterium]